MLDVRKLKHVRHGEANKNDDYKRLLKMSLLLLR